MIKVKQLANNQFIIENGSGLYFQSYKSIIVKKTYCLGNNMDLRDKVELDQKYWNYSRTTSKYRNQFLGETTKETQAKINSGEYVLTDLNQ